MTALERLKALLPADDPTPDAKLEAFLVEAENAILDDTNRITLPPQLVGAQVQLALLGVNRQGMEGETHRSEGGVSLTVDILPPDIRARIARYVRTKDVLRYETSGGSQAAGDDSATG